MSDEVITPEVIEKAETEVGSGFWGEVKPTETPKVETVVEEIKEEIKVIPVVEEKKIEIPVEWLKKEFEIEDPAILKAEREELKTLKANPPKAEEIKFADDQSKRIYELLREGGEKKKEVLKFLATQEKLETLVSSEVTKENAADIVKFGMLLKSKESGSELTDFEINRIFNRKFQMPEKPSIEDVKSDSNIAAEDEDKVYQERLNKWQSQVDEVNLDISIEAKQLKPDLEKAKTELVLPEIKKEIASATEPTQEDLDKAKEVADGFLQAVELGLKNLVEISTLVKDEAVEIPVSYTYTDDERKVVMEQVKSFVGNNFDSNEIFGKMWTDKDGNFDIPRMVEDLAYLNNRAKITTKLANDSASKRLKEYTKDKKNIHLPGVTASPNGQFEPNKAVEEVEAAMWGR